MFKDLIIDSVEYYQNNHKTFACTDCHSSDYRDLPHKSDLKLEAMTMCMDCHDDSEFKPGLNFKTISDEYDKSVHATRENSKTNCWSCHNPHSYRITTRSEHNLKEVVAYDNSICLECHSGMGKFDLLYGDAKSNLLAKHQWLPDPVKHFKSARCIECHTEIREDMLVAHNIRPKEEAIKTCAACHSADSRLKHTLYKYQLQQQREEKGVFSSIVSGTVLAVGTNPSPILNLISLLFFAMAIGGIIIHSLIRILKK
jgi:NAD-dependent SIR2 family protein deacetylase